MFFFFNSVAKFKPNRSTFISTVLSLIVDVLWTRLFLAISFLLLLLLRNFSFFLLFGNCLTYNFLSWISQLFHGKYTFLLSSFSPNYQALFESKIPWKFYMFWKNVQGILDTLFDITLSCMQLKKCVRDQYIFLKFFVIHIYFSNILMILKKNWNRSNGM